MHNFVAAFDSEVTNNRREKQRAHQTYRQRVFQRLKDLIMSQENVSAAGKPQQAFKPWHLLTGNDTSNKSDDKQ